HNKVLDEFTSQQPRSFKPKSAKVGQLRSFPGGIQGWQGN
ncbi:hypothetical protein Tco_1074997, partial [Tanacetum coccineum]